MVGDASRHPCRFQHYTFRRESHGRGKTPAQRDQGAVGPAAARDGRFALCRVAGKGNPADVLTKPMSVDEMRVKLRGTGESLNGGGLTTRCREPASG